MNEIERHKLYREAANKIYGSEGEVEIDDDADVSEGLDGGAYVEAWVWVPYDAVGICTRCGLNASVSGSRCIPCSILPE